MSCKALRLISLINSKKIVECITGNIRIHLIRNVDIEDKYKYKYVDKHIGTNIDRAEKGNEVNNKDINNGLGIVQHKDGGL
ncbi:MAG: hypothetical protein J6F30_07805 [Cellulosilyticum sp.]|nr:hypothetical protein [Cellulosilyticum sp.]